MFKKGYFDAFCVILIWTGFILVSRIGGKSELLPYDVVALRFGTAAVLLLPLWIWRNRVNLLAPKIITLGFIGGIGYAVTAYLGFKNAPAAHGAILIAGLLPFQLTFFSWLLLHERPSAKRVAGLVAIALGVVCLGVESLGAEISYWIGDVAFIVSSSLWAFYSVLVRRWKISVWDTTIGSALVSAIIYLPVYWILLPKHIAVASWETIGLQSFYQGVMAVIVAMILYMRAINALGPSKVGLCMALVPAVAGVAAVPFLGEPLSLFVVLGLVLTSIGAWIGNHG